MNRVFALLAFLILFICGCSQQTKEDIEKDTQNTAVKASQEAKSVMGYVEMGAENAAAATTLTPRLKAAITADPELNNDKNLINIDSNKDSVTIDGHVYSEALKAKAESVIKSEMQKANAKQSVTNNLTVRAG